MIEGRDDSERPGPVEKVTGLAQKKPAARPFRSRARVASNLVVESCCERGGRGKRHYPKFDPRRCPSQNPVRKDCAFVLARLNRVAGRQISRARLSRKGEKARQRRKVRYRVQQTGQHAARRCTSPARKEVFFQLHRGWLCRPRNGKMRDRRGPRCYGRRIVRRHGPDFAEQGELFPKAS